LPNDISKQAVRPVLRPPQYAPAPWKWCPRRLYQRPFDRW